MRGTQTISAVEAWRPLVGPFWSSSVDCGSVISACSSPLKWHATTNCSSLWRKIIRIFFTWSFEYEGKTLIWNEMRTKRLLVHEWPRVARRIFTFRYEVMNDVQPVSRSAQGQLMAEACCLFCWWPDRFLSMLHQPVSKLWRVKLWHFKSNRIHFWISLGVRFQLNAQWILAVTRLHVKSIRKTTRMHTQTDPWIEVELIFLFEPSH